MAAVRRTNTGPELELRRRLHATGLRFRKDYRLNLPAGRVRPDVVFTRRKVAVFLDGCFWHVCPEHASEPKKNAEFWRQKLARNFQRDRANDASLRESGWTVVRIWEHERLDSAVERVKAVLASAT